MAETRVYTDQKEYRKFLASKCNEHGHHHEESPCGCKDEDNKCSCCPPGLVALYDDKGIHLGCLTPNDIDIYHQRNFTCQDGYVVLIQSGATGDVYSCISEETYLALNPPVTP